jgi:hypothetical protein
MPASICVTLFDAILEENVVSDVVVRSNIDGAGWTELSMEDSEEH